MLPFCYLHSAFYSVSLNFFLPHPLDFIPLDSNALALVDQRNQDRNTAASALVIRKARAVVAKMVLGHASELKDNDALPPEAQ